MKIKEEISAPTNAMGGSSSTAGPIQTYDPLMKLRKILRRVNMTKKSNDPAAKPRR